MEIQKINEILRTENQCIPSQTLLWKKLYAILNPQQLKKMFNEKESFLDAFSANKQIEITSNEFNIWFGAYPTLSVINAVFPRTAQQWLILQLIDLQDYLRINDTERLTALHNIQLSELIFREFYYLKASEIMYFFILVKSAIFGKIYNKIDPMNIMEWLRSFVISYREPAIDEGMRQIEAAYNKWHDEAAVKGRNFNRELPAFLSAKEDEVKKQEQPSGENTAAVLDSAKALVNNTLGFSDAVLAEMCKSWAVRYGCSPEEYINNHNEKEV